MSGATAINLHSLDVNCVSSIHKKGHPKVASADAMAALRQRFDQKL
jgi:ethanolamine ammonia-lyase small subunit